MIRSVSANNRKFRSFEFRTGLNIIVAERVQLENEKSSASARRTRNGAGKSSIIDIIHFLLGGKPEAALASPALTGWAFDLNVDVGDDNYNVVRDLDNPKEVLVRRRRSEITTRMPNSKWLELLGAEWFNLRTNKEPGAASYRQLISYFARRKRDGGYDSPIRTFRAQNNAVSETNLALLFGLDPEIVRRFYQAKFALRQNDVAQKALGDIDKTSPIGKRRIDTEAQLSAQIAASTLARDNLKEKIETFNVLPAFRELETELADINQGAIDLSDQDVIDKELIDACTRSMESDIGVEEPQLEKLFAEAQIVFPNVVTRQYTEVQRFHSKLIENRRSHLRSEIEAAQKRIDDRQNLRQRFERRRVQIVNNLRSSGPADELLRLRGELAEKDAAVRVLETRLEEAKKLEERGEDIKKQIEIHTRALRQDRRERSLIIDQASRTFSQISERLYEQPGELAISASERGLQFVPATPSDQSAGVMSMEIFCFDLTVLALCESRGIGPGFLIHDSHLFEPVDGRQFSKALRIAAKFCEEHSVQYIVALNSDELSRAEIEGGENFSEFVIKPVLSDAIDGGLFGFKFD